MKGSCSVRDWCELFTVLSDVNYVRRINTELSVSKIHSGITADLCEQNWEPVWLVNCHSWFWTNRSITANCEWLYGCSRHRPSQIDHFGLALATVNCDVFIRTGVPLIVIIISRTSETRFTLLLSNATLPVLNELFLIISSENGRSKPKSDGID